MDSLTLFILIIAFCIGVFAGAWLYKRFRNRLDTPKTENLNGFESVKISRWPLLLVMLTAVLLFGVLVWSVNYHQDVENEHNQTRINASEELFTLKPPKVEHLPPPVVSMMPPPRLLPSRTVYINVDGRKAYLQSLSVWWEDTEAFENISFWKLGRQLMPRRLYIDED